MHPARTMVVKALTAADAAVISGNECDGDEIGCETFIGQPMLSDAGGTTLKKVEGNLTVLNKRCQPVKINDFLNVYQDITGVWVADDTRDFCQARWIVFNYEPGGETDRVTPTAFFDGQDPTLCSDDGMVDVQYPIGQPLCESRMLAFYDPNTDKYQAMATPSATMGEPEVHTVVKEVRNDPCGVEIVDMEFRMFPNSCNPAPGEFTVQLGESMPVIVAMSSEYCGRINYAWRQIRAFPCGSSVSFADFGINFDGVGFVVGASFGPQTCLGSATWTFNTTTNDWDLTTPCESGCVSIKPAIPSPLPSSAITQTSSCDSPINGQCGLNLSIAPICGSGGDIDTAHVPLPLEAVDVVTEVVDNVTDLRSYKKRVYVCNFEDIPDDIITAIEECPEPSEGGT